MPHRPLLIPTVNLDVANYAALVLLIRNRCRRQLIATGFAGEEMCVRTVVLLKLCSKDLQLVDQHRDAGEVGMHGEIIA